MKGQENDNKYILLVSLIAKIPKKWFFCLQRRVALCFILFTLPCIFIVIQLNRILNILSIHSFSNIKIFKNVKWPLI